MNAIITGAGRNTGIGAQICRSFAEKGINVYFTTYDKYDLEVCGIPARDYEITFAECQKAGVNVFFGIYDLTTSMGVKSLFDDATSKLGNIDILVNCLCYHTSDALGQIEAEILSKNLDVNTKAVFLLCQEFYLRFSGNEGSIINLSSTQNMEPLPHEISYALSKAAIPVLVNTLAQEMAKKNISINAVNPGPTEIGDKKDINLEYYKMVNPFGRLSSPQDTANIVLFLVSHEGHWITGQTINSEGGIYRGIPGGSR